MRVASWGRARIILLVLVSLGIGTCTEQIIEPQSWDTYEVTPKLDPKVMGLPRYF